MLEIQKCFGPVLTQIQNVFYYVRFIYILGIVDIS